MSLFIWNKVYKVYFAMKDRACCVVQVIVEISYSVLNFILRDAKLLEDLRLTIVKISHNNYFFCMQPFVKEASVCLKLFYYIIHYTVARKMRRK